MRYLYLKILELLKSKKKQILFALFALITIIFYKKVPSGICLNAVPVAVAAAAEGAAAAGGAAAGSAAASASGALGKTVLEGASQGAKVGAVDGAINKDEDENVFQGAAKGAAKGAIKGGTNAAVGSIKTSNGSKNTNPNANKDVHNLNSNLAANNEAIDKNEKIDKSKFDIRDKKKDSKSDNDSSIIDDDEEMKTVKKTTKIVLTPLLGFGCAAGVLLSIILAIPMLVVGFTDPISTKATKYQCSDDGTGLCIMDKFTSFLEKVKNLIVYQEFNKNDEIIIEKIEEVNKEILKNYMVSIDIPTLISTIMVDDENMDIAYENGELLMDSTLKKRLNYLYVLGEMQISLNEVAVTCMSKDVGGKSAYYKETNYSVNPSNLTEGECNSFTVGKTFKETSYGIDLDAYYEKLRNDKELLREIYPDLDINDEELVDELIENIKLRKDMFLALYSDEAIMDVGLGNVPMSLFYDSNVNFTSPLKGSVSVTSPYGQRTGIFSGMHKGIDLVSNDKTIYATGNGVVTRANTEIEGGNVIEITHTDSTGHQYITTYGHLSQFLVKKGSTVKSGDVIGIMGATGTMASGVHLHFQVTDKETKETYNPANVLSN